MSCSGESNTSFVCFSASLSRAAGAKHVAPQINFGIQHFALAVRDSIDVGCHLKPRRTAPVKLHSPPQRYEIWIQVESGVEVQSWLRQAALVVQPEQGYIETVLCVAVPFGVNERLRIEGLRTDPFSQIRARKKNFTSSGLIEFMSWMPQYKSGSSLAEKQHEPSTQ